MEEKLLPSPPTAVGCEIQVVLEASLVGEGLVCEEFYPVDQTLNVRAG